MPVDQIEKIFMTAQKQRNWDHFTRAQRKNIELWLKQAKVGEGNRVKDKGLLSAGCLVKAGINVLRSKLLNGLVCWDLR